MMNIKFSIFFIFGGGRSGIGKRYRYRCSRDGNVRVLRLGDWFMGVFFMFYILVRFNIFFYVLNV